jgi:hypothetical protein
MTATFRRGTEALAWFPDGRLTRLNCSVYANRYIAIETADAMKNC